MDFWFKRSNKSTSEEPWSTHILHTTRLNVNIQTQPHDRNHSCSSHCQSATEQQTIVWIHGIGGWWWPWPYIHPPLCMFALYNLMPPQFDFQSKLASQFWQQVDASWSHVTRSWIGGGVTGKWSDSSAVASHPLLHHHLITSSPGKQTLRCPTFG